MTCVMQGKCLTLNTPHEFFQSFHTTPVAIKNLLCELFLYNLVVTVDRDWNPLPYVGDIQLWALMSQIQNEVSRGNQAQKYRELEYEIPLFLRLEANDAKTLYYDQLKIAQLESRNQIITP